ncbi:MAG: O-antigen ligase family protein [Ruminococcaceae bacterium]|nr:O-antigen ligase family protein [Oscillospiraceae bacterium]
MDDLIKNIEYKKFNYHEIILTVALLLSLIFTGGLYWYHCIIPILLIAICLISKLRQIKSSATIYSLLILAVSVISLYNTKGDFQTGVYEIEKIVLFIAALLSGTILNKKETITYGVYISSVVCALFGIIVYCGLFEPGEYLLNDFGQIRLQSFFKYANTTACFFAMGYYSGLKVYQTTQKSFHLYAEMVILIAMLLTMSKALIPMFFVLGLFYIYRNKEISCFYVNSIIWSLIFIIPIILLVEKRIYFISFIVAIVCIILGANVRIIKTEKNAIIVWVCFLITGIVAGIVLLVVKPYLFTTFSQRITYMADSLETLLKNIIIGSGPGSWRVLKYSFQSAGYNVLYMHNSILQFAFENGIVFTFLLIGLICKSLWVSVKKKNDELAIILLLLLSHSFIDFDLSFGTMLIVLGVVCGKEAFENNKMDEHRRIKLPFSIIIVSCICLSCVYMVTEYRVRASFEKACLEEAYDEALEKSNTLEWLCPRDSILQLNIASLIEKTSGEIPEVKSRIDKARVLSPADPVPYEAYVYYNMNEKNLKQFCLTYINMRPRYEGTHQTVKNFINRAFERSIINEEKRNALLEEMGEIRFDLKVYDRDELLDRIMNQRQKERKEVE